MSRLSKILTLVLWFLASGPLFAAFGLTITTGTLGQVSLSWTAAVFYRIVLLP